LLCVVVLSIRHVMFEPSFCYQLSTTTVLS
jgi:hypothetical protein